MGCVLAGCCPSDKNNYRELDGRQQKTKTAETRRQQQERRGVPRDPNSRNSHRRHDKPREEIEMKTFLASEGRRFEAGDGDGDGVSLRSTTGSATSVSTSENRRKQMLDAVERRHQEQRRLDEIIQKKRSREEKMEKRERELAKMGGSNLRWQM